MFCAGQYYYLKIEAMDKDNNEYEDEYAEFNIVQTNCGCQETDTSGPPVNMAVEQYMGKLFFSWEDQVWLTSRIACDLELIAVPGLVVYTNLCIGAVFLILICLLELL